MFSRKMKKKIGKEKTWDMSGEWSKQYDTYKSESSWTLHINWMLVYCNCQGSVPKIEEA